MTQTPQTPISFSRALEHLRATPGARIQRAGWNGKNMYVELLPAEDAGTIDRETLVLHTVDGETVAWTISQTDALGDDWSVLS